MPQNPWHRKDLRTEVNLNNVHRNPATQRQWFTGIFSPLGNPDSHSDGCAAGNAGQYAFFPGKTARVIDGFFVTDLLDVINQGEIEHSRDKTRADALDFMRARC